jgi:catechol 2,3-dioxygenase-like lactoylglutathione lyase family enzyme
MNYKLEVVVVPVTDIDRAKAFYVDTLGFRLDGDTEPAESARSPTTRRPRRPPGPGSSWW